MCYNPQTIINPSKYVDIHRHDRFMLQVPCGKCADCQKRKSLEWNFRTLYEFIRTFEQGLDCYAYFDTLTYDDAHLPRMSEIIPELPPIPCFRSSDVTKFFKRLRQQLKRKYGIDNDAFSYFLCSEYGSLRHRPHYHLIIFMRQSIPPLELSRLVSQCWKLGRTDGIPYKGNFYVLQHNVLKNSRLGDTIACVKYVTKYVEKDCKLQEMIDKRIKNAETILSKKFDGLKENSVEFRKLKTKIASEVDQFHLQSLHYGELALRDIDLSSLVRTGCLSMPSHNVVTLVPLPTYYERKLFYERYKLHGNYGWQLNSDGKAYKKQRAKYVQKQLANRLLALNELANTDYDCDKLANYILNERGRYITAVKPESILEERLDTLTHYVYVTQSDKAAIGTGISFDFIGNSQIGYTPLVNYMKIKDFIKKYVYFDDDYEKQLTFLYSQTDKVNQGKQLYYARLQELKAIFKQYES